jgi:hypothetical protein
MTRLPRFLLLLAIVCSISLLTATQPVKGQPAGNDRREVDRELLRDVDNFWHYAKIARYDLARAEAERAFKGRLELARPGRECKK